MPSRNGVGRPLTGEERRRLRVKVSEAQKRMRDRDIRSLSHFWSNRKDVLGVVVPTNRKKHFDYGKKGRRLSRTNS